MSSEFWRYFRNILRWPLIHNPGPLSALVQGKAHSLDATRDDIIYFRRQWLPEYCEESLVPDFGKSRALTRLSFGRSPGGTDAARTKSASPASLAQGGARAAPAGGFVESAAQFRSRVINAWKWHLLGGKAEGLPEILRFYGFEILEIENLRSYQPSRWAEFQIGLKIPSDQSEQETLLVSLPALVWLINEYKPARSILARIYTDTYNLNPAVWSGGHPLRGEKTRHGWSEELWSLFSGVYYETGDNNAGVPCYGLVVSFGMARRFMSERYNDTGAGLGVENIIGISAPYLDRPIWSRALWGETFPRNHGFVAGEIVSLHWCERTTISWPWQGGWDKRPWCKYGTWDRVLPQWKIRKRQWAKVHAVWGWPSDGKEAGNTRVAGSARVTGEPSALHDDGAWGDVNACYGRPAATIYQGTCWGDIWGKDPQRQELEILERWRSISGLETRPARPGTPVSASHSLQASQTQPLRKRGWAGVWGTRRWNDYVGEFSIRSESE